MTDNEAVCEDCGGSGVVDTIGEYGGDYSYFCQCPAGRRAFNLTSASYEISTGDQVYIVGQEELGWWEVEYVKEVQAVPASRGGKGKYAFIRNGGLVGFRNVSTLALCPP